MRKKDIDVLERLARGRTLRYEPYRGWFNPRAYYFFEEGLYTIPESTMERLERKGWIKQDGNGFRVTEKGYRILAATKGDNRKTGGGSCNGKSGK